MGLWCCVTAWPHWLWRRGCDRSLVALDLKRAGCEVAQRWGTPDAVCDSPRCGGDECRISGPEDRWRGSHGHGVVFLTVGLAAAYTCTKPVLVASVRRPRGNLSSLAVYAVANCPRLQVICVCSERRVEVERSKGARCSVSQMCPRRVDHTRLGSRYRGRTHSAHVVPIPGRARW